MQIEKWAPGKKIAELFSEKIQIAIQIHNLPVEYRRKQFAVRFAEKVGTVIHDFEGKESDVGRDEVRKYTKFKVEIDLANPIVPGWTLDLRTKTPIWIDFKYERLPNICFTCKRFDHETQMCSLGSLIHTNRALSSKFGP